MKIIHYICANWGKTALSMPCKNPQKNVQIYFLFENLFVHLHRNFKNVVIMEKVFDFKNGQLSIVDGVRFVEAKSFAEEALDFTLAQVKELIIPPSVRGVEVFALEGFCNLEKLTVPAGLLGEDEGLYSNRTYYTRSFTRMLTNRRCRLMLLGPLFRKKNLKDLANIDEYPYIIVWEDYATVLRKLTEAGWGQINA